jgi:tetratricopeptide (TPR) repeat protein
MRGDPAQAEPYQLEALQIARQWGYRSRECLILNILAIVAMEKEDFALALQYGQEALAIAREIQHKEYLSTIIFNLALTLRRQGEDLVRAHAYHEEAVALARQIGNLRYLSWYLSGQAEYYLDQHDYEAAGPCIEEMRAALPQGDLTLQGVLEKNLGWLALGLGEFTSARRHLETSLEIFTDLGDYRVNEVRPLLERLSQLEGTPELHQSR